MTDMKGSGMYTLLHVSVLFPFAIKVRIGCLILELSSCHLVRSHHCLKANVFSFCVFTVADSFPLSPAWIIATPDLPSQYCTDLYQANQQHRGEAGLHPLESTQACRLALTRGLLSSSIYPRLHLTGFTSVQLLNKLFTSPTLCFSILHSFQFPSVILWS